MIKEFNPYSETDLLKAHEIITFLTVKESGKYRKSVEGVLESNKIVFIAPPANLVPKLMHDLFNWLKNDNEVPLLIKSCIFHYEFIFIHPFVDENGRTVRLWQNVLLKD